MNTIKNLNNKDAIDKLKSLINDIIICLFCTNLKTYDGYSCHPMAAIKVCDQGNIWFFSEKSSDKNKNIITDKNVRLFFSYPAKNIYLVVNGEAEIIVDKAKIGELWTRKAKIWFKDGKEDPTISIIKVKPIKSTYWDNDGNRIINFLKLIASVTTGTSFVEGKQGTLKV